MAEITEEIRQGFQMLARDMREIFSGVKADIIGAGQLTQRDISQINMTAMNQARVIEGRGTSFLKETFGREFNKPGLWSRDIIALMGREYVDMTRQQSEYYAHRHWQQRGEMAAVEASSYAAWGLGSMGGLPGLGLAAGYQFIGKPILEKTVLRQHEWWNYLDKMGKRNILAGQSRNAITFTGFGDRQLSELSRFLPTAHKGTGWRREEAEDIMKMADQWGYFKGVADVDKYKQKYKELFKGVKEIMQTLHTSAEEGVKIMTDINRMGVTKPIDYIKRLNVAAAYSGLSPEQITAYTGQYSEQLYQRYGISREKGAEIAASQFTTPPKMLPIKRKITDAFMQSRRFAAAFFEPVAGKPGEFVPNLDAISKIASGEFGMAEYTALAVENVRKLTTKELRSMDLQGGALLEDLPSEVLDVMTTMVPVILAKSELQRQGITPIKEHTIPMMSKMFGLTRGEATTAYKEFMTPKNREAFYKQVSMGELPRRTIVGDIKDIIGGGVPEDVRSLEGKLFGKSEMVSSMFDWLKGAVAPEEAKDVARIIGKWEEKYFTDWRTPKGYAPSDMLTARAQASAIREIQEKFPNTKDALQERILQLTGMRGKTELETWIKSHEETLDKLFGLSKRGIISTIFAPLTAPTAIEPFGYYFDKEVAKIKDEDIRKRYMLAKTWNREEDWRIIQKYMQEKDLLDVEGRPPFDLTTWEPTGSRSTRGFVFSDDIVRRFMHVIDLFIQYQEQAIETEKARTLKAKSD